MDYHYFKDKLNQFYGKYFDLKTRPTFFNITETYPSLDEITKNFETIRQEFNQVLQNNSQFPRYHDIDPGEAAISNACEKQWNVFMVHLLGYHMPDAARWCPKLSELLQGVPHLIQAFFSILEPGKSIPLHEGPYLGYLRYHLGIHVPKDNPPHIIVNKQPHTWREGEAVLFDDSWPHAVNNQSEDYRAVLIIDVLRPMPFWPHLLNLFVTKTIARYFYGRKVIKRTQKYGEEIKPIMQ